MVVDLDREILLGVTFVGPGVGELLHSATVAVAGEVPIDRLWHAVPSLPDDQRGLAAAAGGPTAAEPGPPGRRDRHPPER